MILNDKNLAGVHTHTHTHTSNLNKIEINNIKEDSFKKHV